MEECRINSESADTLARGGEDRQRVVVVPMEECRINSESADRLAGRMTHYYLGWDFMYLNDCISYT